jgi:glycogen(starch) synthase
MKVVISTYTFSPNYGGVETTVSVLAQEYHSLGYDTTVVTSTPGALDGYDYKIIRRPGCFALWRLYRSADVLLLSNLSIKLLYPLFFMRRRFGLSHHSESAWSTRIKRMIPAPLYKNIMSRAVHFVTSDFIGKKSGLPYVVTHPFANPAHLTPGDVIAPALRKGVIFVGRFVEGKGVLFLLEHWQEVGVRLGEDELTIVGDGELCEEVNKKVTELNKAGCKVTCVGSLSLEDTAKAMQHAAFSIVPSLWEEPFGAVASESLAAGAITIHSSRGGLSETTGGFGFQFDPDDEVQFHDALEKAGEKRKLFLRSNSEWDDYISGTVVFLKTLSPEYVAKAIVAAFNK